MATEDIKVVDGHIVVDRIEGKQDVDVAASDVDSVVFTRGVWNGPGTLEITTKDHELIVIRVDNEDAGEALAIVESARSKKSEEDSPKRAAPVSKTTK